MYVIVEAGGKQYRASQGDVLRVEKMDAQVGDAVTLDKVLMLADNENVQVGSPYLNGVSLSGKVIAHGREKKISVFHYKRKKNIRKFQGHRQYYTEILVEGVSR
jgi:large subunit ribosomal protein L21